MEKWIQSAWTCFFLLAVRQLLSQTPAEVAKVDNPAVEVKVEGALLRYVPREIPIAQRTPRGEIDVIESAVATLKVGTPVAFRRVRLPAGEYGLQVAVEDGKNHYLVLEPKPSPEESQKKGPASGKNDQKIERRDTDNAPKALEKSAGSPPRNGESEPAKIRVPLSLSPIQSSKDALSFDLKLARKGSRLRVILRAGSTEARTSQMRLGEK